MHEAALALAALPAEVRIGIPLRPYSLGHELFLIREQNPLITGGDVQPGHIYEAVWICSSSFRELTRPGYLDFIKAKLLSRKLKKIPLEDGIAAFREYRQLGSLEFPLSQIKRPNEGPTRDIGSPFLIRLHHFLC